MIGLTRKQRELYDFIAKFSDEHGHVPSLAEMAAARGICISGVCQLLRRLEARGAIRRGRGAREIEIISRQLVSLSPEIDRWVDQYASEHRIQKATAVNALLRAALEAA